MWLQNLIIFVVVAVCLGYIGMHGVRALMGRKSKLGSCCAKGCETVAAEQKARSDQMGAPVQFMPVEMLMRKRR